MGKRALVVDDDASTRFVLGEVLKDIGIDVVLADDGQDVPELLQQQRFDLLVIDLYMPGMNGFEVLRHLRRPEAGILPSRRTRDSARVLVVSGESHTPSIANARALGADEYLVKPIDVDVFEETARRLLAC